MLDVTPPRTLNASPSGTSEIAAHCEAIFSDLDFGAARRWKSEKAGRKVIGYMPFYVPRELIHAAGALPLGIMGGGDQLEVIHGDAYYQSYICRIPRSTIELGVSKRLDFVDGMLFPSICDVIRNLSGMWKLMFPDQCRRAMSICLKTSTTMSEARSIAPTSKSCVTGLQGSRGRTATDEAVRASIGLFNENRALIRELYALRAATPWKAPSTEVYLLLRAGLTLPVEEHNALVRSYIDAARSQERPMKDNSRVVINGVFCEQPPLNLIKAIELSGCYIVDDDFMLVTRWEKSDVALTGDPIAALASAYLHNSLSTSAKYEPDIAKKGAYLVESVRANRAEGVIFAMPSFCDPALLERPMLQNALKAASIPYIAFKYAENSGQMQPIREQAGTFADSIKLWSGE